MTLSFTLYVSKSGPVWPGLTCCGQAPLGCICNQFGSSPFGRTGSNGPWRSRESSCHEVLHSDQPPQIHKSRRRSRSRRITSLIPLWLVSIPISSGTKTQKDFRSGWSFFSGEQLFLWGTVGWTTAVQRAHNIMTTYHQPISTQSFL